MQKWNSFTCIIIISWQIRWFWAKMTITDLGKSYWWNLKKVDPNFFHDYLNAVRFNLVLSRPYMHFFGLVRCVSFMLCSTLLWCFILLLLMFWTSWIHPAGSKHQLDRILINSKWVNSLRNGRAYNTVELGSDHRIVTILLVTSSRTSKVNPCKRPISN